MKIAIVHDFLKEYGGAERVVEVLHEIYPDAPIYTAFVDYEGLGPHAERMKEWNIKTTWAQEIPFITKIYSPLRFLAPFFFRSLNLRDFDVIISSSNAYYAKGILKSPPGRDPAAAGQVQDDRKQVHICYCHTPPRSLYGYATAMDWKKNPIIRVYGTIINHFLRMYDFKAAQAVDYFIANSEEVKRRIKKFYRRDSVVIYPPVSPVIARSGATRQSRDDDKKYYLYVGKLAYAKHVDLVIAAANKLKIPLKVVGKGGEEEYLKELARKTARLDSPSSARQVEFLGEVSDNELNNLYAQSKALVFTAEDEDFGIVPVEAMAHGVPVIAHRSGGVMETVIEGKTGVFFNDLTVDSLSDTITSFARIKIKKEDCIKQAKKFSKERFKKELEEFVNKVAIV